MSDFKDIFRLTSLILVVLAFITTFVLKHVGKRMVETSR